MTCNIPWSANPARVFFQIILATFWGLELKMHKTYKSKSFGAEERNALKEGLLKLPDCPLRKVLLRIAAVVGPPPNTFQIKSFQIKNPNESVIMTHEIMGNPYTFTQVAALGLMKKSTHEILRNLWSQLLIDEYKEDHIARFLAQFWLTSLASGWTVHDREALSTFLVSFDDLPDSFRELLDYPLSNMNPVLLYAHYGVSINHDQAEAIMRQNVANRVIQESTRSKEEGTLEQSIKNQTVLKTYTGGVEAILDVMTDDEQQDRGKLL